MKQIKRFLFNFNRAYFYTFFVGILVSLAANLFTTALLTEKLPISFCRVYGISLSLFLSAIGAFGISALLENARSDWESSGTPRDPEVIRKDYVEKQIKWMWFFFLIIVVGIILSAFLYSFR
ncbi:MAG: hypothetical protein AAB116_23690 [Candidatus Poribacteria bacterium]